MAEEPIADLDIIDCHTHFYDPTRPEGIPWPGKGTALYRTVLPKHLRALKQLRQVTGTVIVGGKFDTHGSRKDKKEAYREMVVEPNKSVGQILAKLKEHGLERKTLVFFFSDNGATSLGSCGSLRGTKGTVWEGGHRVPGIARWLGRIKPGETKQTAIGMDLMPTMLKISHATLPDDHRLDGVD